MNRCIFFGMKWISLLAFVFAFCTLAHANRMFISPEQKIERTPVIFEADVIEFKTVPAPNHEMYFAYDKDAMEVSLRVSKSWKGNQKGQVVAYTWALGKAPCKSVEIKKDTNYLIYAEWDKSKKNLMFDYCSGFHPTSAKYLESDRSLLKKLYP